MDRAILLIHGGAGTISRAALSPARERAFRASLAAVLRAGQAALRAGAPALDVVTAAVRALEEDGLYNAGFGAVLAANGAHELDAAVMGAGGRAGAVAGTARVRNPVLAARALLDAAAVGGGGPVLLAGAGADAWAAARGLETVDNAFFTTPHRAAQLAAARAGAASAAPIRDHDGAPPLDEGAKRGTVGAVALDAAGGLAAATSTGGLTNKVPGRVGDSPVFGAGTWADERVAVSGTGTGEAFLRCATAKDIAARVAYGGAALAAAARAAVDALPAAGGDGGVICVGADGAFALTFNTEGMYRGVARAAVGEGVRVGIYGGDEEEHVE
jgi:beta-aspartyl-peptidase (threonine type)